MEGSFAQRIVPEGSRVWSSHHIVLTRSVSCPWHVEEDVQWSSVADDQPIRTALCKSDVRVQLLWTQCLEARCRRCGQHSEPHRRVAWVRCKMICAACGASEAMEPLKVIDSIGTNDPEADLTPRQLGLPSHHLWHLRRAFVPAARRDIDESIA